MTTSMVSGATDPSNGHIKSLSPPQSLTPMGDRPKFVEYHDDFICPVCNNVLQRPMQTECGHLLCEECLDMLLAREEPHLCPGGENSCIKLTRNPPNVRLDYYANRKIRNFQVMCNNYECQQTMPWSKLQAHMSECQFTVTPCPNAERGCPDIGRRDDMAVHCKVCQYRLSECMYCHKDVMHKDMRVHQKEYCEEFPVHCPHNCQSSTFTRKQLESHRDKCPARPVMIACSYQTFGCTFQGSKQAVEEHMQNAGTAHVELITVKVAALDLENTTLKNQLHEVKCATENVTYQVSETRKALNVSHAHTNKMDGAFKTLQQTVAANTKKIASLGETVEHFGDELTEIHTSLQSLAEIKQQPPPPQLVNGFNEAAGKANDHELMQLNVQLADLDERVTNLSVSENLERLPWRIPRFSSLRLLAESGGQRYIDSPSFYTEVGPYHVKLRLYPAGDGLGVGTHVSLYLQILQGLYDNIAKWPFDCVVHFELIDQVTGNRPIRDIFMPDAMSSSFQKPEGEDNIASGAPKFVALLQLDRPNSIYLVKDTLFIRFSLNPADQYK